MKGDNYTNALISRVEFTERLHWRIDSLIARRCGTPQFPREHYNGLQSCEVATTVCERRV